MLTLALKRLRGCTSLFWRRLRSFARLDQKFYVPNSKSFGKIANFYFVFSHHNSSEPEEKIKKREELYRFACPDKRELDDIVEGTQVNCLKFAEPFLFFSFNSSRIRLRLCKHWWNSLLPNCPERGLICFTISQAFLCKIIHRQSYREKYPSIQAKKWKVFCYLRITHASSAV